MFTGEAGSRCRLVSCSECGRATVAEPLLIQLNADLRASASRAPCSLRKSLDCCGPGSSAPGLFVSDPGQSSGPALAAAPPLAPSPAPGRHAFGVLAIARA